MFFLVLNPTNNDEARRDTFALEIHNIFSGLQTSYEVTTVVEDIAPMFKSQVKTHFDLVAGTPLEYKLPEIIYAGSKTNIDVAVEGSPSFVTLKTLDGEWYLVFKPKGSDVDGGFDLVLKQKGTSLERKTKVTHTVKKIAPTFA